MKEGHWRRGGRVTNRQSGWARLPPSTEVINKDALRTSLIACNPLVPKLDMIDAYGDKQMATARSNNGR